MGSPLLKCQRTLLLVLYSSGPQPFWLQGQFFHGPGVCVWGDGFRMIQVRYIYCVLICIIITSAPPQIIRHEIPEFGDPLQHVMVKTVVNINNIKVTILNYTAEWHLVHSHYCETISTITSRTFSSSQTEILSH